MTIRRPVRSPIRSAHRRSFDQSVSDSLTIPQLLPSGAGRVAAIYSDPARPSYDECIQKNMAAIAAGRPQDCVLFADAAGQTPVVYPIGAGQGKGLLLDRSAGLVLGAEMVTNGTFDAGLTGWTSSGPISLSSGEITFTNGTTSNYLAQSVPPAVGGDFYSVELDVTSVVSGSLVARYGGVNTPQISTVGRHRFIVKAGGTAGATVLPAVNGSTFTVDNISVRELPGHHQQQPTAAARGDFSKRLNQLLATATLSTQSITAIATQYRLYFTGAGTVTLSGAATGTYSAGSHAITCTAGSLTLTVAGSVLTGDLRFEADATIGLPEYQRVTTASDYDEVGFPTYWRAVTDDWAKSRMNPNGATKSYIFWAGQHLASATGFVVETSPDLTANNGGCSLYISNSYGTASKGTSLAATSIANLGIAKRIAVDTGHHITNDVCRLTVNGTTSTGTADQGTGAYLEYDVFFGARAGTSLFANIREYAPPTILFLQSADSLSASHLSKLQRGYAKAVGVTL